MSILKLCVDFVLFPDNTPLPNGFTLSMMTFTSPKPFFVNETAGKKGLQFEDDGLQVSLPTGSSVVDLSLGTFASDVIINVLDDTGAIIFTHVVPGNNSYNSVKINNPGISKVVFKGGGNEAILENLCMTFD